MPSDTRWVSRRDVPGIQVPRSPGLRHCASSFPAPRPRFSAHAWSEAFIVYFTQILFPPFSAPVQSDYSTHCLLTAVATNLAHQPLWWCTCRVRPRIGASTAVWRASVDWGRSTVILTLMCLSLWSMSLSSHRIYRFTYSIYRDEGDLFGESLTFVRRLKAEWVDNP